MFNIFELSQKVRPLKISSLQDIGDILQYLLPWAGLLTVALLGNQTGAWRWLWSGLAVTGSTFVLKLLFNFTPLGRRPNGDGMAFPSGHTSSAFMGAAFIHFQFTFGWAILPYLLAALTGYSRIQSGKHWWRDVIAGAVLAIGLVYTMFLS
ncbi:MAG: phosphatase PAP2 family protein [Calditrichia bacterium]